MFQYSTIEEALEELRQGRMILCTDAPDRENEGDLICAAQFATTENVNFMATHAKGLICMPMSAAYIRRLQLPQMVPNSTDNHETAFTVSIDHVETATGISAAERSVTAMRCVEEDAKPEDFRRPGHMFPLLGKAKRRVGAGGAYRGHRGPLPTGGAEGVRALLRDYAGGRHHDAGQGAAERGCGVGAEIYHDSGSAGLSQAP